MAPREVGQSGPSPFCLFLIDGRRYSLFSSYCEVRRLFMTDRISSIKEPLVSNRPPCFETAVEKQLCPHNHWPPEMEALRILLKTSVLRVQEGQPLDSQ